MKISRRKNIKIIYIEKPQYAQRGYNMAVEVYEIKDNHAIRIRDNPQRLAGGVIPAFSMRFP